ncbi:bacterial Ig-like domain protein [Methanobrevibacter cuticularis]|uniref:Bacterial Ig-like domain protein n=1 Tax=Methanobrevibacter cuticularis TaxID=47311 RepID=A0A166CGV3_9EURY|nr:hypothetical protein [Methanobrevibacter cuticularis]KZX14494.1 bacterial Ig-like domain protein [Methanobrevibacter cuticularis]
MLRKIFLLSIFIAALFSINLVSASDDFNGNYNNYNNSTNDYNDGEYEITNLGYKLANNGSNSSNIYVDANLGSDSDSDGSEFSPYKSLQKAIKAASSNSNIYIMSGEYFGENNTKIIIDKKITISTINGIVIFNGEKKYDFFEITSTGNLTLINITFIQGRNIDESYIAGAIFNNGDLTIKYCIFESNVGLRGGAILNNGKLEIIGSTFKNNNGTNYGGGVTNFNIAKIVDCLFINNIASRGSGIFTDGNLTVISSNFSSNTIVGVNWENRFNTILIKDSDFSNSDISTDKSSINILNTNCSNVGVTFTNLTVVGSSISISATNSTLNVIYSVIIGGSIYNLNNNNNISAEYNWWLSNKGPNRYSDVYFTSMKYWIVVAFVTDYGDFIPSKSNLNLKVVFKYTDGVNIWDLPEGINIPARSVYLQTDNGYFINNSGLIFNNSFVTGYLNNTDDTIVYAVVDDQRLKLLVGKGYTNYTWYVSNNGDDSNTGSKENPFKTLAKAVSIALNGDTIYIDTGEYYNAFNSNLFIWKNLTFTSYNGPVTIYRHTNNNIFVVADYGTLNLNNISFSTYNLTYSVLFINCSGNLTINNCTFRDASGNSYWGNILFSGAYLYINNSNFYGLKHNVIRSKSYDRSSYDYVPCNISIFNSYFSGISGTVTNDQNTARILYLVGDNIFIENCTFVNNSATGAYIISNYSIVNNSIFINNHGAINGATIFDNGFVVNNTAPYWSGPIVGASNITNSIFLNNNATSASGRFIYNCSFINNSNSHNSLHEDSNRNGIINNVGNLSIVFCTFIGNNAGYGGAIFNSGTLNISNSIFLNNSATILGADIFNFNGNAYLDNNWWGWNGGSTDGRVYRFLGDIHLDFWSILTLSVNGSKLTASLDKVTDKFGNIYNLNGSIPNRFAFFDSNIVSISPKTSNLTDNHAYATITSSYDDDYVVNVTVDSQTVDLTIHNMNTILEMNNGVFYGKNNIYTITLRNINGYDIYNQTIILEIKNKNGSIEVYYLITDDNGRASIILNKSIGSYELIAYYKGDGYFYPSNATALLTIISSSTNIFILKDQIFYGKNNLLQVSLEDIYGQAVTGQKITFRIAYGNKTYTYYSITDGYGVAGLTLSLPKGSYNIKVFFDGDEWYNSSENQGTFTILPIGTNLILNISILYGRGDIYFVKLLDNNGNVVKNETIYLTLIQGNNNQTFIVQTDSNGTAKLVINLLPGTYKVYVNYKGDDLYIGTDLTGNLVVEKVAVILTVDPLVVFNGTHNKYYVLVTDMYGRPLYGESISIKVQKDGLFKVYDLITDEEGFIILPLELDEGNYMILVYFNGNEWYYNTTTASTLIVESKPTNKIVTNLTATLKNNTVIFYLTDIDGTPLMNKNIVVMLVGTGYNKTFIIKTNNQGKGELKLNMGSGKYNLYYNFEGNDYYGSIEGLFDFAFNFTSLNSKNKKIGTYLTVKVSTILKGKKTLITVILKDLNGKLLSKQKIKLLINKKTHTATTNSKGIAIFKIFGLKTGKHLIKLTYVGNGFYKTSTISKTQSVKHFPDLIISKIKRHGNKYKIAIKNQGSTASKKTKLKISFIVGKNIKQKIVTVKGLQAGKFTIVAVNFFKYSLHKKYIKTARINYNRVVKEFSYKNNLKKFKI